MAAPDDGGFVELQYRFDGANSLRFIECLKDERGRIGDPTDLSAQISSTIYLDFEAGWQFNDNWRVVLGAVNVTDEFISPIGPPNANRLSVGLQYPRRTVANYEGGSWYLRASYNW